MDVMHAGFSLDEVREINEVISDLYNEQLTLEDYMSLFMNKLKEQVYFDKSDFMFYTHDEATGLFTMQKFSPIKWTDSEIDNYIHTYMHLDDVLPVLSQEYPIAFRNNDLFSLSERKKTKYYKEFVEDAQLTISIDANIPLPEKSKTKAIIGLFRNFGQKEFTQKELEVVRLYQTHLSKTLSRHLIEEDTENDSLFYDFNRFESFGICIINENRELVSFNTAYRKYATGNSDSVRDSHLTLKLKELADEISDSHVAVGPVSFEIGTQRYLLEITRYSSKKKYLCIIHSLSDYFLKRLSLLKDTYGVSNREIEILFLMLKSGMTVADTAERLYISPATVKRHISGAYQKIGVNNQRQLLNKLKLL